MGMNYVKKLRGTRLQGSGLRRAVAAAAAAAVLPGLVGLAGGSATAGAFSRLIQPFSVPPAHLGMVASEIKAIKAR